MFVGILLGFAAGCIIEAIAVFMIKSARTTMGVLKIDKTNPEKDTYCLDIGDLDALEKKKRVELIVSVINDPSQK